VAIAASFRGALRQLTRNHSFNYCVDGMDACLKVAEAESIKQQLRESDNRCLYLKQQLEGLREDVKTVLCVRQWGLTARRGARTSAIAAVTQLIVHVRY